MVDDLPGGLDGGLEVRVGAGAEEAQFECEPLVAAREGQHRPVVGEQERVARPLREVADALVGLAGVRGEGERRLVGVRGGHRHGRCEEAERDAAAISIRVTAASRNAGCGSYFRYVTRRLDARSSGRILVTLDALVQAWRRG